MNTGSHVERPGETRLPFCRSESVAEVTTMFMSSKDYRESLRALKPNVYVQGRQVDSIADDELFAPGVNAIGLTYDYALREELSAVMRADGQPGGDQVNRMIALAYSGSDLLNKLEAVRLVCQETGCAQRYLTGDALNGLFQATHQIDEDKGTDYSARFDAYLKHIHERDLAIGIAMTDVKGDRSKRPHEQDNPDTYVHLVETRPGGIVISGVKAIVTSAPYVHELLVMPGRSMTSEDAAFAV